MVSNENTAVNEIAANLLFDQRFANRKQELNCFIEISIDTLKIAFYNESSNEYVGYNKIDLHSDGNWSTASKNCEKAIVDCAKGEYKGLKVSLADSLYTLVPNSLFDPTKKQDYLAFNHKIEDLSQFTFYSKNLDSLQAVLIYALPRNLDFMLRAKLPVFVQTHAVEALIESLNLNEWLPNQLHIHIHQERFEVIYFPKKKLQFCNSFTYKSSEDFIYFLLYVMEQLKLDREKTEIILHGDFEEDSPIYKLLYTYIQTVTIAGRTPSVHFSNLLSEIPKQYHYSIFNMHLCE